MDLTKQIEESLARVEAAYSLPPSATPDLEARRTALVERIKENSKAFPPGQMPALLAGIEDFLVKAVKGQLFDAMEAVTNTITAGIAALKAAK